MRILKVMNFINAFRFKKSNYFGYLEKFWRSVNNINFVYIPVINIFVSVILPGDMFIDDARL